MSVTPVASLKAHLNLEHDLDDAILSSYLDAAEAYASDFVGQFLDVEKPAVKQAVLLLAGFWYENREAAQSGGNAYVVPFGVHDLLQAYRKWAV